MTVSKYAETRLLAEAQNAVIGALVEVQANLMIENVQLKEKQDKFNEQLKGLSSDLAAKDRHILLLQSELKLSGRRITSSEK